jgi:hypothetical protein
MTEEEFADAYAKRSGVTVEWLREHGREARPCDCGEDGCDGWQMAHVIEETYMTRNTTPNIAPNGAPPVEGI